MLMEWVPGETLLDFLLDHPMTIWSYPGYMAELQVRLNTMPIKDFPRLSGRHLPRGLESLREIVRACDFKAMTPGIAWLEAHQPDAPITPCILHLDFRPSDVMIHEGRFARSSIGATLMWAIIMRTWPPRSYFLILLP